MQPRFEVVTILYYWFKDYKTMNLFFSIRVIDLVLSVLLAGGNLASERSSCNLVTERALTDLGARARLVLGYDNMSLLWSC